MDTNMKVSLCVETIENAIKAFSALNGIIIHSDRGSQYTSELCSRTAEFGRACASRATTVRQDTLTVDRYTAIKAGFIKSSSILICILYINRRAVYILKLCILLTAAPLRVKFRKIA